MMCVNNMEVRITNRRSELTLPDSTHRAEAPEGIERVREDVIVPDEGQRHGINSRRRHHDDDDHRQHDQHQERQPTGGLHAGREVTVTLKKTTEKTPTKTLTKTLTRTRTEDDEEAEEVV